MNRLILGMSIGLALWGTGAMAQSKFNASMRWCGSSPEFKLSGLPKGTTALNFQMVDLNVPGFPHGGGQLTYQTGQNTIECGEVSRASLGQYQGPRPPAGEVHTYQWTIRALDAKGGVLGQAVTQRKFPD